MIYWRQKRVLEEIIITNTNKLTTEWLQSGQLLLLQPGLAAVCFLLLHYTIPVIQNVSSAFSDWTQAGLSYFMSTLVVLKPCWASRTHLSLCICHLGLSGLNVERKHCADEWESCKDWWADEFDWECANQYHNTIITTARLSGFLNDAITSNMVYYHYICTSSGLMKSFILPVTVAEVKRLFTFPVSKPLNSPPVWRSIWYDVRPQNRKRLQNRDGEAVTPAEGEKKRVSVSVCHVCMMPGKEEFIKLDQNRLSSANTTYYWYPTSECKCLKVACDCCESSSCSEQRDCAVCRLPRCPQQQASPASTQSFAHLNLNNNNTHAHTYTCDVRLTHKHPAGSATERWVCEQVNT